MSPRSFCHRLALLEALIFILPSADSVLVFFSCNLFFVVLSCNSYPCTKVVFHSIRSTTLAQDLPATLACTHTHTHRCTVKDNIQMDGWIWRDGCICFWATTSQFCLLLLLFLQPGFVSSSCKYAPLDLFVQFWIFFFKILQTDVVKCVNFGGNSMDLYVTDYH